MPSSERRLSGHFRFRTKPPPTPTPTPPLLLSPAAAGNPLTPDPAASHDDTILFPRVYEGTWGGPDTQRTELDRARILLLRMALPAVEAGGDKKAAATLRDIVCDEVNRTVPGIAWAIQTRIYGSRHAGFATTPLMQAVRFVLIKAGVPQTAVKARSRAVLDFFFDPTLHRNLDPPPAGDLVRYAYPSGRLRVCIVGGGPTGLASAISLVEKGRGRVEVHVWERRWVVTESGTVDYPPTARRRDQVVTLQDSVTQLLSARTREALFEGRPERVWPASANIQIRKVEDRLLSRCQTDEFYGLIHLHAEAVTREALAAGKCGDFHLLLGTDGAASWVRASYFRGYEEERGRSYALGLAFDRGPKAGLPWSQPLNMFLTLGQTRYLLNASDHDGRGYLNMQLTEEEWAKMVGVDGKPIHFGSPACLRRPDGSVPEGFDEGRVFAPSEDRGSPLWRSIEDGLKLFGFKEDEVINVVRIPIVVQAVREGVQQLPREDSRSVRRPHALVAVAGDAAMTVHFWPGRGLNSGIKAGIALGDEICHALHGGRFAGLPLSAMREYNDFLMKLQGREHDKRSIPILNQSGSPEMLGWLLKRAQAVPDEVAVEWLVGAMTQLADRLEQRNDWYFPHESNVEAQVRIILRQLHSLTLREMAVSFPWPTREMAGAEVLPVRSMRPEEKRRWVQQLWALLTADKNNNTPARGRDPSASSTARFEAPRLRSKSALAARSKSPLPETQAPPLQPAPPVITTAADAPTPPPSAPAAQAGTLSPYARAQTQPLPLPRPLSPTLALRRSNATYQHVRRISVPLPAPIPAHMLGAPPSAAVGAAAGQRSRSFSSSRTLAVPVPVPVSGTNGGQGFAYPYQYQHPYQYQYPHPQGPIGSDGEDWSSCGDERFSAAVAESAAGGHAGSRPSSPPDSVGGDSPRSSFSVGGAGDGGLTRLLSVKRPNDSFLEDAMSLALFRVSGN